MIISICNFLEHSAMKFPNKAVFVENQKSITYSVFYQMAKALASKILEFQIKKEPVLIILPKGIDALIAFFGSAISGNFYSIIDEKMPKERVAKIIAKLNPKLIITSKELYFDYRILTIFSDDFDTFAVNETALKSVNIIDTDLLYVLFTSGSTGEPKGVAIRHKSVIDYTFWVCEAFGFNESSKLLNQAPFYFDNSVLDIYGSIASGATLHIIPNSLFAFPKKICEYIEKNKINTIFWVPSVLVYFANLNIFKHFTLSSIEKILFCGEVMPTKQLNIWRKALPNVFYANLYGPTEITDVCSYFVVDREFGDDELLPIGKACKNTELLVFDENMSLISPNDIGRKGELYVRGTGLSVGYYNDSNKTAAAFIQNPLQSTHEEKIYKTGDIVAYNKNKELVCYGRSDSQIKLNGHRIELGEIEAALSSHPSIKRVACIFKNNEITVFYESDSEIKDLKEYLYSKIPNYMIPRKFIKKDELPQNTNDKIDRKMLINMI